MQKRTAIFISTLLILSVGLALFPCLSEANQPELPPVEVVEGQEPVWLNYGEYTTGARIDDPTDIDRFSFYGSAGDSIRVLVSENGSVSPRLEIWGPNDDKIVDTYASSDIRLDETLTTTGTYLLAISDYYQDYSSDYTLQLEKIPPVFDPQVICYDSPIEDRIDHSTDMDFFSFEGEEGAYIRVLVSENGSVSPRLEIWGPNDDKIVDTYASSDIRLDETLTTTGTYLLAISDYYQDYSSDYGVEIQCLLGNCPSSALSPTATTNSATSVTSTSAILNGTVNPNGASTTVTFEYGTTTSYGSTITATQSPLTGCTGQSVSIGLTDLTPGTTYHFRVKATNSVGTTYGSDTTFFTTSAAAPAATTNSATSIASGSATLNGTVNPNGASTTVVFEYGTSTSYGSTVTATQSPLTGTGGQAVSASLSGLTPGTTYHFRAKATNSVGTAYGSDQSFTYPAVAPAVVTGATTSVTTNSATLNGTVIPEGMSTTYYFEYGTTTSYGSLTGPRSAGAGWTDVDIDATIAPLAPSTTYHYRLVATNSAGTSDGVNKSFTTQPSAPTPPGVVTGWATEIGGSSAKLNGSVNPNGATTTYYFEYGTTTGYGSTTTSTSGGSGTNLISVDATLTGLSTNTTYHFRLVASNSGGTAYGTDQSFTAGAISKVIIVSGGGPYAGNNIWTATEMNSGYAFRALLYQGYTKDSIYYLSPNTAYDVDGDGKPDVDAAATSANLENAIKSWAQDASQLFLYLIGHGGTGTYRINVSEVLSAENLDVWLDDAQNSVIEQAVVLYDSCRSGSFLPLLIPPSGKQRILATSASSDENTLFSVRGTLSFSYLFWSHMFNGDSFYDCFLYASNSVALAYPNRMTPQIEGNGNGIGNEKEDKTLAQAVELGLGIQTGSDLPTIGSVSSPDTVSVGRSAVISVTGVVALNGVSRVWAVITPPGYSTSPDQPVTDLPTFDLSAGNSRYEGTYSGFTTEGTYNIAIFVEDNEGFLSLPVQTTIVSTSLSACPECSASPVILTNVTFSSACECSDITSITIGTDVTIKSGATVIFKAPTVKIQSGFHAEEGSVVNIKQQ